MGKLIHIKMDDEDLFLGDLYIEYIEGEEARA